MAAEADSTTRRTLSVLVEDVSGRALQGLRTLRPFNIDSLAVGPGEIEGLSRITVAVSADSPTCWSRSPSSSTS